jgi:hypothetical protein
MHMAHRVAAWAEWTCNIRTRGRACKCRLQSNRAGFGLLFFVVRQAGALSLGVQGLCSSAVAIENTATDGK